MNKKDIELIEKIQKNQATIKELVKSQIYIEHFKTDDIDKRDNVREKLKYLWCYDDKKKRIKQIKDEYGDCFTMVNNSQNTYRFKYAALFAEWGNFSYSHVEIGSKKKGCWEVFHVANSWWKPKKGELEKLQEMLNNCKYYGKCEDRTIRMWSYPQYDDKSMHERSKPDVIITKDEIINTKE